MLRIKPQVFTIQNPASKLKAAREVKIVRYIVEPDDWKKVAS
jgi:hypothetical protein